MKIVIQHSLTRVADKLLILDLKSLLSLTIPISAYELFCFSIEESEAINMEKNRASLHKIEII